MNTTDFLSIASAICPDRDAIVFEGKRWTYSQTGERVNRLSNALIRLGVKKGDRVAILQVNCLEIVESYFATATLGGIFVPLNFRAKADELNYMLGNAEAKILFVGKRYLDMARTMLPDLAIIEQCICLDSKETDMPFYGDMVAGSPADEVLFEIGDEDITILMYTAGTTGRPKGVPLRHDAFVSYVLGNVESSQPGHRGKEPPYSASIPCGRHSGYAGCYIWWTDSGDDEVVRSQGMVRNCTKRAS